MAFSELDVSQTVNFIIRRRPVLEQVLRAFESIFMMREALAPLLVKNMASRGIRLPAFQREHSLKGVPALSGFSAEGLDPTIREAASKILPLLSEQSAIIPYRQQLEEFFLAENEKRGRERILEAIFTNPDLAETWTQTGRNIPPQVLNFAGGFVFSTVLRALAKSYPQQDNQYPWDTEGIWKEGYCPFCGAYPSIAWLGKRDIGVDNPYLVGGGGKKRLHCPACGTDWKFQRAVCPACGGEGDGIIQILKEVGNTVERVDWCTRCKTYCTTIDLRELAEKPQMDIMALGLLHLDMMAREKNLQPLAQTFWNTF